MKRSIPQLLLGLFALLLLGLALFPFLLPRFRGPGPPEDVQAAARLALSTAEELKLLPEASPLLKVNRGESSSTWQDVAGEKGRRSPERLDRDWTVESVRYDPSSKGWRTVPGGTPRDALRVSIRVRLASTDSPDSGGTGAVLARLTFYRFSPSPGEPP